MCRDDVKWNMAVLWSMFDQLGITYPFFCTKQQFIKLGRTEKPHDFVIYQLYILFVQLKGKMHIHAAFHAHNP